MADSGKLTLVATPIGNLGDLSPRSASALAEADFWFVEDTRVSGKLAAHLKLKKSMKVVNEHTSPKSLESYCDLLLEGGNAALVTDGGCPVVSDPGTQLVELCLDRGIEVDAVPGPSAVTTALMLSGFFGQRFAFLGFLPRKPGPIIQELSTFAESPLTLVIFESPFRLEGLLTAASKALGERRYVVCRELTKIHQQIFREKLPIIPSEKQVPRKGECTVVIEGLRRKGSVERELKYNA